MPNIRIMNWNIEQLSWNKIQIAGMADAIAATVVSQNVDILIILEVRLGQVTNTMNTLSAALNARAGDNDYTAWFLSDRTGGEAYGFIIRDLDIVRPVEVTGGPTGASIDLLSNLHKNTFAVWPSNDFAVTAYPIPGGKPMMPLTDLYATKPPRGRIPAKFGGQQIGQGGYSLGRGFRLPCLAMFMVHSAVAGATYLLPTISCHYAAVRGGRNHLAQGQTAQLKALHIAQLFNDNNITGGGAESGYIDVDNAAENIQEIVFTGDYNMDFLQNNPAGNNVARTNHAAYSSLTPTIANGGSALPAALPAAAGAVPAVPFAGPFPDGPVTTAIHNQALKAAATTQGTHLVEYDPLVIPPNTNALKDACFDNFIFGGTQLSATVQINFGVGNVDAADVVDVPANIVQPSGAMGAHDVELSGTAAAYLLKGTKNAAAAPSLQAFAGTAPALTVNDRLIGARLVSDHLPVVVQYNLP